MIEIPKVSSGYFRTPHKSLLSQTVQDKFKQGPEKLIILHDLDY